jgi:AcrR family transcriptional regulator
MSVPDAPAVRDVPAAGSAGAAAPAPSLREIKKSRTRQHLAETALRMFAERGYTQTSVEEIAREAQFGVTTFFRHFATKEDVAFYDQGNWMEEIPQVLLDRSPEQVWSAVRDATLDYIEAFQDPQTGLGRIRRSLWLEEPAVARRFAEISLRWEAVVAQVIADGLGLDADRDPYPRMAANALIGAARAALWHQHRHGGSMLDYARACLAVVEPALLRPPPTG